MAVVPEQTVLPWNVAAEVAAQAQGAILYVGVRPHGRGWFAHCDQHEVDASDPEMAVWSLIAELTRAASTKATRANSEAKGAEQRHLDLAGIALPPSLHDEDGDR